MNTQEAIEMMGRCASEIEAQRAEIARLAPKAAAYDAITQILGLLPRPSQGYGEDLAWTLRKRIGELKAAEQAGTPTPPSETANG